MHTLSESFVKKHLTNLAEWRKMGEAGIFPPDSHLELINGEIIEMAPIGSNHSGHINRFNQVLTPLISSQAIVSIQNPLQLGDLSEPVPDMMLLKPHTDFYTSRHPQPGDVLLLIEVADSSLMYDQNQKLHLYALHQIHEYWIINLDDNLIEVYRQPNKGLYAEKTTLSAGEQIKLSKLDNITIEVNDIL